MKAKQDRCKKSVYKAYGTGGRFHQCSRKATRDGFCTQHHPDATAVRRAERTARLDAEAAEIKRAHDIREAKAAVVEAAMAETLCDHGSGHAPGSHQAHCDATSARIAACDRLAKLREGEG